MLPGWKLLISQAPGGAPRPGPGGGRAGCPDSCAGGWGRPPHAPTCGISLSSATHLSQQPEKGGWESQGSTAYTPSGTSPGHQGRDLHLLGGLQNFRLAAATRSLLEVGSSGQQHGTSWALRPRRPPLDQSLRFNTVCRGSCARGGWRRAPLRPCCPGRSEVENHPRACLKHRFRPETNTVL